jgi:hypothetical protein
MPCPSRAGAGGAGELLDRRRQRKITTVSGHQTSRPAWVSRPTIYRWGGCRLPRLPLSTQRHRPWHATPAETITCFEISSVHDSQTSDVTVLYHSTGRKPDHRQELQVLSRPPAADPARHESPPRTPLDYFPRAHEPARRPARNATASHPAATPPRVARTWPDRLFPP